MLSRRRPHSTDVVYWACTFVPTCAIALSCVGFLVTRLQVFSDALNGEYQRRAQEAWLRSECKKPDFYANMQLHADLCDKVEAHARGNAWLAALAQLFEKTYLCGYSPCAVVLDETLDWVAGHGVPFLILFAVLALLLPTVLVPMYRQYLTHVTDVRVSHRFGDPYGRTHMLDGRTYPLLKVE
jgi:hypothetical protein